MGKIPVQVDLGELLINPLIHTTISDVMHFSKFPNTWKSKFSGIAIDGPGLLTGTAKVQVSDSEEDTDVYGTTWRDKQSNGVDIEIPADGHVTIKTVDWKRLRIVSSAAEAAPRRFRIKGLEI